MAMTNTAEESGESTGKERDQETGLDNFGARYFSASEGRFTSPDWSDKVEPVPYANFADPQTLNLYSYVRNNPTSVGDADGHCYPWCTVLGGAFLGGVAGGGAELVHQYFSGEEKFDWNRIKPERQTSVAEGIFT